MKLQALRPIIWTNNLSETIAFYTNILNFEIAEYNPNWQWACLFKDKIEIMVSAFPENSQIKKPIFTGSLYFNVDDVEQVWENLKTKAKICYEIETFDWGMKEFAIYDTNGYVLQFGEETKNT